MCPSLVPLLAMSHPLCSGCIVCVNLWRRNGTSGPLSHAKSRKSLPQSALCPNGYIERVERLARTRKSAPSGAPSLLRLPPHAPVSLPHGRWRRAGVLGGPLRLGRREEVPQGGRGHAAADAPRRLRRGGGRRQPRLRSRTCQRARTALRRLLRMLRAHREPVPPSPSRAERACCQDGGE